MSLESSSVSEHLNIMYKVQGSSPSTEQRQNKTKQTTDARGMLGRRYMATAPAFQRQRQEDHRLAGTT